MARQNLLIAALLCGASTAGAEEVTRARRVMGTLLTVSVRATDAAAAARAADAALDEVDRWDRLLSTYKPESEVSRLNAAAPERVALSTDTAAVLAAAHAWARKTDRAFDFTVGPLVRAWGFDTATPDIPSEKALDAAMALVGAGLFEVDGTSARLFRAGMSVDLGAFGKGWALDRALEKVSPFGVDELRMDFGGQLLFWSKDGGARWTASLRAEEGAFSTPAGSLATSAQTEKYIAVSGRPFPRHAPGGATGHKMSPGQGYRLGHILDPRTGWPAEGLKSVTVWAPTAEEADVLSTALFVLGARDGFSWAERNGAAALFTQEGGRRMASSHWKRTVR